MHALGVKKEERKSRTKDRGVRIRGRKGAQHALRAPACGYTRLLLRARPAHSGISYAWAAAIRIDEEQQACRSG